MRIKELKAKPYWLTVGLAGILLLVVGVFSAILISNKATDKGVEIVEIDDSGEAEKGKEVYVDVAGAVMKPGLYKLSPGARMNDALVAGGGLGEKADREWLNKNLNLAAKIIDGTKIYIPFAGEGNSNKDRPSYDKGLSLTDKININTASSAELDTLWGVGPATAEKIISNRPYGSVEELLTKKAVKSNVYETIKEKVAVY